MCMCVEGQKSRCMSSAILHIHSRDRVSLNLELPFSAGWILVDLPQPWGRHALHPCFYVGSRNQIPCLYGSQFSHRAIVSKKKKTLKSYFEDHQ